MTSKVSSVCVLEKEECVSGGVCVRVCVGERGDVCMCVCVGGLTCAGAGAEVFSESYMV